MSDTALTTLAVVMAIAVTVLLLSSALVFARQRRLDARQRESASAAPAPPAPAPVICAPATEPGHISAPRLTNALGLGLLGVDSEGRIGVVNAAAQGLLQEDGAYLRGRPLADHLQFLDAQGRKVETPLQRSLRGARGALHDRLWLRRPGGVRVGLEMVTVSVGDLDGLAAVMLFWDADTEMREQNRLQERVVLADSVLARTREAVAVVNAGGRVLHTNDAWSRLFGIAPGSEADTTLADLIPDPFASTALCETTAAGRARRHGESELAVEFEVVAGHWGGAPGYFVFLRAADVAAPAHPVEIPGRPAANVDESFHAFGALRDHADLVDYKRLLERLERHLFAPGQRRCALAVVDVVGFKRLNRRFGRTTGNAILAAFGSRLAGAVASVNAVAHLGGDEFALLQVGIDSGEAALDRVERDLADAFSAPLRAGDYEVTVGFDVGMSVGPDDADVAETLLAQAETALYAVKVAGDRRACLYAPEMAVTDNHRESRGGGLDKALIGGGVDLRLYPIQHAGGGIAAASIELSWQPKDGEPLVGRELLQYARRHDLVGELGAWAVRRMAQEYAGWRDMGLAAVPLILPADKALAATEAVAAVWSVIFERYQLPDGALILSLPPADAADTSLPAGTRLAVEADLSVRTPGAADLVLLTPEAVAVAPDRVDIAAAVKALSSAGRKRNRTVIGGPVVEPDQRRALQAAGAELFYGPAVSEALAPRVFGRFLARHGAQPI